MKTTHEMTLESPAFEHLMESTDNYEAKRDREKEKRKKGEEKCFGTKFICVKPPGQKTKKKIAVLSLSVLISFRHIHIYMYM